MGKRNKYVRFLICFLWRFVDGESALSFFCFFSPFKFYFTYCYWLVFFLKEVVFGVYYPLL